jgi:hypothetical protein
MKGSGRGTDRKHSISRCRFIHLIHKYPDIGVIQQTNAVNPLAIRQRSPGQAGTIRQNAESDDND